MLHGNADISSNLVPHISSTIADILLIAGLNATLSQIHDVVVTTFEEKLTVVVRLALALNWVIGRDITSADLEPSVVLWDADFDPVEMEDVHGEGARKDGKTEHVLCTTDLGLQHMVKAPKDSGSGVQTTTLLKPKVVLESVIDSLEGVQKQIMDSPASMATHELSPT